MKVLPKTLACIKPEIPECRAKRKSRELLRCVRKSLSVHTLWHSFAIHLLECGIDLRHIQEMLHNKSSKTTEIYTHVSRRDIRRIKSPLDNLNINQRKEVK